MAAAIVLTVLVHVAWIGAVVWGTIEVGWWVLFFAACLLLIGADPVRGKRKGRPRRTRAPSPADKDRVERVVRHLCLVADLDPPTVAVEPEFAPLSWTTALPWQDQRISVTTGLLDRLEAPELEAVIAHEVGHIANRDAMVMTTLAGPPTLFFQSLRRMWDERRRDRRNVVAIVCFYPWPLPVMALLVLLTRGVSRARESAADRAAAVLTGSPAAVMAALIAVSDDLAAMPAEDLRLASARDPFHFVPAREARGIRWLLATHPRSEARITRLRRVEETMQHARLSIDGSRGG